MLSIDLLRQLLVGDCPERCATYAEAVVRSRDKRESRRVIRLAGYSIPQNIRTKTNERRALRAN